MIKFFVNLLNKRRCRWYACRARSSSAHDDTDFISFANISDNVFDAHILFPRKLPEKLDARLKYVHPLYLL